MAQSEIKAASENDRTPAGEETLDFDDSTLRGETKSLILFTRIFQYIKPTKSEYLSIGQLRLERLVPVNCVLKVRPRIYPRVNLTKLLQLY